MVVVTLAVLSVIGVLRDNASADQAMLCVTVTQTGVMQACASVVQITCVTQTGRTDVLGGSACVLTERLVHWVNFACLLLRLLA